MLLLAEEAQGQVEQELHHVKSVSPSTRCSQIPAEDGLSGSRNGEKEKDSRISSNDEPMSRLQYVTIQHIGIVVG